MKPISLSMALALGSFFALGQTQNTSYGVSAGNAGSALFEPDPGLNIAPDPL